MKMEMKEMAKELRKALNFTFGKGFKFSITSRYNSISIKIKKVTGIDFLKDHDEDGWYNKKNNLRDLLDYDISYNKYHKTWKEGSNSRKILKMIHDLMELINPCYTLHNDADYGNIPNYYKEVKIDRNIIVESGDFKMNEGYIESYKLKKEISVI